VPKTDDTPVMLRPFVAHGFDPRKVTEEEAEGECPFCGGSKFFVGLVEKDARHFPGGWTCHNCGISGNVYGWLKEVWQRSWLRTESTDHTWIAGDRGLDAGVLRMFGVCKSVTTGEWIVPGYNTDGAVVNLCRYRPVGKSGKHVMIPTPGGGLNPGFFGENDPPTDCDTVVVCEGVWNAAAWRSVVPDVKTVIVGTPGAGVWSDQWTDLCVGKDVVVLYDNDHPKVHPTTGAVTQAGWAGTRKVCGAASRVARSVKYLDWGCVTDPPTEGYDPGLPTGYDVRDVVTGGTVGDPVAWVQERLRVAPAEWGAGADGSGGSGSGPFSPKNGGGGLRALRCTSWEELRAAWRACDHLNPEFERGMLFGLCVACGVEYGECRLWGKMLGVAGTGKSTICDGLATARFHVISEGTINNMYSGFDTNDGKDHSFASKLPGMCWIYNDADTLLQNPNRDTILSQMRELYGGNGSKTFGNKLGTKSYHNMKFSVLIAGTPNVKRLDSAELGGRYLDFLFQRPDPLTIDRMLLAAIDQQMSDVGSSGMTREKEIATRKTGGYVEHLRKTVLEAARVVRANVTGAQKRTIGTLAKYVAVARSRRPKDQDEITDATEIPTRLAKQLSGLAVLAAVVKGRDRLYIGTMSFVRRVALDTAVGTVHNLLTTIAASGDEGIDMRDIVAFTKRDPDLDYADVMYLGAVGHLEMFQSGLPSLTQRGRWRLTPGFRAVYRSVFPTPNDRVR
jgi:hypothetical protein